MLIFDQLKKSDHQLQWIAWGVLGGMWVLLMGLWYVQVISEKRYQSNLQDQSIRTVRLPAIRGKILDRNRIPLADNRASYNVNLYLEELRRSFTEEYIKHDKREFTNAHPSVPLTRAIIGQLEREARFHVVSNYLFQVSSIVQEPRFLVEKEFNRHYDEKRSLPLTLVQDLSIQQVARFVEKTPNLSTISLDIQPVRIYPFPVAAHLLGHLRLDTDLSADDEMPFHFPLPDYTGAKGIEWAFNDELRGRRGAKTVLVNRLQYRQSEEVLTAPTPGQNVVLTLDLHVQEAAERALAGRSNDVRGAVVAMDTRNGDILAMASSPTFDPNRFNSRISDEEWASLNDSELKPMFNRAIYGAYPPGSIFKIIVGLAGLEAGAINPEEIYRSRGFFQLRPRGHIWHDTAGEGDFDFRKAFYKSSNPYFSFYGLKTGPQKIVEMGRRFGLGERTGIVRGLETPGYFPKAETLRKQDGSRWMDGDTVNLCIGQGELKVTPLQMAVMTAAVANGGKLLKPRLIVQIEPQESNTPEQVIRFPAGEVRRQLNLNPQQLQIVRAAMLDDVEHRDEHGRLDGTGKSAAVKEMRVCGKTGTAQQPENGKIIHVTWFVSFAPFENARYAVVVVVEEGYSGGSTCAPIARDIYQALVKRDKQLGLPLDSLAEASTKTREQNN